MLLITRPWLRDRTGPSRFGLKVRKSFVAVGRRHYCQLPNGARPWSALSQDKELKNRVMQIVEIINPIFEFLRKLAVIDLARVFRFET